MKTGTSRKVQLTWLPAAVLVVLLLSAVPVGAINPDPERSVRGTAKSQAAVASAVVTGQGSDTWSDAGTARYYREHARTTLAPKARATAKGAAMSEGEALGQSYADYYRRQSKAWETRRASALRQVPKL